MTACLARVFTVKEKTHKKKKKNYIPAHSISSPGKGAAHLLHTSVPVIPSSPGQRFVIVTPWSGNQHSKKQPSLSHSKHAAELTAVTDVLFDPGVLVVTRNSHPRHIHYVTGTRISTPTNTLFNPHPFRIN